MRDSWEPWLSNDSGMTEVCYEIDDKNIAKEGISKSMESNVENCEKKVNPNDMTFDQWLAARFVNPRKWISILNMRFGSIG